MNIDNLRELSLTSTSKGMLYKCIGNIDGKKVYIKTGTKFRNKLSILEPVSEVIASEIIKAFNIPCANNTLKNMKLPLKFAPLYDHGLSLYADIQDFELEQDDKETWEMIDECKPFAESHYKQLELIGSIKLKRIALEELFCIVDKYKEYLSNYRIECIKYLLETRYNYLIERKIV